MVTMDAKFRSGRVLLLGLTAVSACLSLSNITFSTDTVTFAKDVAPILQAKCQECHRQGSMAPMSLITYEETRPWPKPIPEPVIRRHMPPWHIDQTVGVQKFKNDMSLSQSQIDTIVRWVDQGSPMGDAKDMPALKRWPGADEWKAANELGQPDIVVKSDAWTMPAH